MTVDTRVALRAPSRPLRERRALLTACQLGVLVVLLLAWQLASASPGWKTAVSSPSDVASVLREWLVGGRSKWSDILSTLEGAVFGSAVGVAAAAVFSLLFLLVPVLARLLMPYVAAFNAVPKVVMAPLFVLWLGFGLQSKVVFVASVVFIIVFFNLVTGLRDVDAIFIEHVRVLGAHNLWVLRSVYLPALVGWIFASLRVSVGFALLLVVVAEFISTNQGVGALIQHGQLTMSSAEVIAGIFIVGAMAVVLDLLLRIVERRLLKWRPE
jgi:NitT/TauT family transport system permease protein